MNLDHISIRNDFDARALHITLRDRDTKEPILLEVLRNISPAWRLFCIPHLSTYTQAIIYVEANCPDKYLKDRPGVNQLLKSSIGEFN